ncbi:unnamed protein product [Nyctereutes procyonoides]|uniref:(raccoon dog) hypothetical protein n=1 Tax=Nyctereutes procyonoides TaxID=34880 RepID=A0A811Y636_NYCPR|nr:unnamed protein product [Nyctereutes procyonoides]
MLAKPKSGSFLWAPLQVVFYLDSLMQTYFAFLFTFLFHFLPKKTRTSYYRHFKTHLSLLGFRRLRIRRKRKSSLKKKKAQTNVAQKLIQARVRVDSCACQEAACHRCKVTRALERNGLLLVLVCKSAKPAIITSHLIQLSSSRSVPACQVPRLSETLTPVIGLKCVLALGFRKDTTAFVEEVKAIIPRVPSLHIPWLHGQPEEAWENEILETSFENLSKHKKKFVEGQQAVVLQPLKIK